MEVAKFIMWMQYYRLSHVSLKYLYMKAPHLEGDLPES